MRDTATPTAGYGRVPYAKLGARQYCYYPAPVPMARNTVNVVF